MSPVSPLPCLVLFTKPSRAGFVKTRLVGARVEEQTLSAADAAELHGALLGDVCERLGQGVGRDFHLRLAWDVVAGEALPSLPPEIAVGSGVDAIRQQGADLGERLFRALDEAAREHVVVAAVGSDHPMLSLDHIRRAFAALAAGEAEVALGPSLDGGYYLVAVRRESLSPRLFAEIDWSTERVLAQTLERCREQGLRVLELPAARDVDRGEDVIALAAEIATAEAAGEAVGCPRTREVLAGWGLLPSCAIAGDQPTDSRERRRACVS